MTTAQLHHAGLEELFERSFSVDSIRRYKPAPETYRYAIRQLGVKTGELLLVAAHTWDVSGALEAGCAAALVRRSSAASLSLSHLPQPNIVGSDMAAVAAQISHNFFSKRSRFFDEYQLSSCNCKRYWGKAEG